MKRTADIVIRDGERQREHTLPQRHGQQPPERRAVEDPQAEHLAEGREQKRSQARHEKRQQAVVDECGQKAVEYERYINRSSDDEIKERWESKNGVTFTEKADMDIDSFKEAVDGVDEWFVNELKSQGYEDGQDLVDLFTK